MGDLPSSPDAWRTALLESSLDCVIIMNAGGEIIEINQGTADTFGVQRDAVLGRRLADVFVPPELRERHEQGLARYLQTGRSAILGQRVEVDALHANGTRIPVELSIVHLAGTDPPLFVGHLQNISARLRSSRRLRVSAAASHVLATSRSPESAIDGVLRAIGEHLQWTLVQFWSVTPEGDRLRLTSNWGSASAGAQPYRTIQELPRGVGLPGETLERGVPVWIEDLRDKAPALPRWEWLRTQGVRSAVCFPVHVEGRIVAVIEAFRAESGVRDDELLAMLDAIGAQLGHVITVHEARRALEASEAALRDALLRAEQARRAAEEANAAKDEFLALISHELRTPLGPIVGWARMLRRDDLDDAMRRKAADTILRNAQLEAQLVEDLLDVSRIVTGKLTIERAPVSMVQVVHAALETSAAAAEAKGVEVRFDGPFDVPDVLGDSRRLQQVISNLVVNAIKFTPAGGEVGITLVKTPRGLQTAVRDTGEGIEPDLLPHIFDRFRQGRQGTSHPAGGLGLGLAIVRDLVARHGGTVEAFSSGRGAGATFTVTLPLQSEN